MAIITWCFIHSVCILLTFRGSLAVDTAAVHYYELLEDARDEPNFPVPRHNIERRDVDDDDAITTVTPTTKVYEPEDIDHKYYKTRYYAHGRSFWYDIRLEKTPTLHKELTKNIKFSDTIEASFQFPYYGHLIKNITITNKGYVFLGERLHKFNASAQYAAPLMADFAADLHPNTTIHFVDTGNRFTVEWSNIILRQQPIGFNDIVGFSFQCSILKNGTLIFAYKDIPIPVTMLSNHDFPVRVGLSDTYRRDEFRRGPYRRNGKTYSGVHFIYYYLYHKVQLTKANVANDAAFVITPETNCVILTSCGSCVDTTTKFSCKWCPKLKRCSDGVDRLREEWVKSRCHLNSKSKCTDDQGVSAGGIALAVLIPLAVVIAILSLFLYAYLHPQSASGMFLIQYGNPTKWCRNCAKPTTEGDGSSASGSGAAGGGKITFKTMPFENTA